MPTVLGARELQPLDHQGRPLLGSSLRQRERARTDSPRCLGEASQSHLRVCPGYCQGHAQGAQGLLPAAPPAPWPGSPLLPPHLPTLQGLSSPFHPKIQIHSSHTEEAPGDHLAAPPDLTEGGTGAETQPLACSPTV